MLNRLSGGSAIQTANFEKKKNILLYANKMHGTLSMVDIAMDRLCVAKTEQLLTGKGRRNQLLVGKNSNVEFDGTEPWFRVNAQQSLDFDAAIMTFPPLFLPNAAQKAICWMFGASWVVAFKGNMQVWTSNTGGVMKTSMKVQYEGRSQAPVICGWFSRRYYSKMASKFFANVVKFGNQLYFDSFHSLWLQMSRTTIWPIELSGVKN